MPQLPKTDAAIRQLAVEEGQAEYRDPSTPGLSLLVGKKRRTWFQTYTGPDGVRKRLKLGPYPAVGLSEARKRSEAIAFSLHQHVDPAKVRQAYKEAHTVAAAAEEYLRLYAPRKASGYVDERVLRKAVIPALGDRKLLELRRADVQGILRDHLERGVPVMANRALEIIRKWLAWCVEQGWIEANPALGISRPTIVQPRSRALSDDELASLWHKFELISPQSRAVFKLLVLTGQREMEVVGMRWSEIDLGRGLWTLPVGAEGRSKKRGSPHIVPLPTQALDILGTLRQASPASATIFVAKSRNGSRGDPTRGIVLQAKVKLDRLKALPEPWRVHDLRRTVRTGLSQLSVPPHIAELVIGHAARGIVKVYDRYDYVAEKREALQRWADHLMHVVGAAPAESNVVQIAAAKP